LTYLRSASLSDFDLFCSCIRGSALENRGLVDFAKHIIIIQQTWIAEIRLLWRLVFGKYSGIWIQTIAWNSPRSFWMGVPDSITLRLVLNDLNAAVVLLLADFSL
jgi:hypothetical protein